jgi:hypothetical protein
MKATSAVSAEVEDQKDHRATGKVHDKSGISTFGVGSRIVQATHRNDAWKRFHPRTSAQRGLLLQPINGIWRGLFRSKSKAAAVHVKHRQLLFLAKGLKESAQHLLREIVPFDSERMLCWPPRRALRKPACYGACSRPAFAHSL